LKTSHREVAGEHMHLSNVDYTIILYIRRLMVSAPAAAIEVRILTTLLSYLEHKDILWLGI